MMIKIFHNKTPRYKDKTKDKVAPHTQKLISPLNLVGGEEYNKIRSPRVIWKTTKSTSEAS
jgi:hypothetical protein